MLKHFAFTNKIFTVADWMPVELEEATSGSIITYSAETQTEPSEGKFYLLTFTSK